MKPPSFVLLLALVLSGLSPCARGADAAARGRVFDDTDRNGTLDPGERGIPGVLVSNGREVVKTDNEGRWELPSCDDCHFFVIKPSGWMTPVDRHRLPRFYYNHKPAGSPELKYGGVPPTGPLPASIDFPLHRQTEPGTFKAIFFADPQARDQKELE